MTQGDVADLFAAIRRLFAGILWRNFTGNDLPAAEGYYASVLYAFFASLNAKIILDDVSNQGQVGLAVKLADYIYVIEIKLQPRQAQRSPAAPESVENEGAWEPARDGAANPALAQLRASGYSAKYRGLLGKGLFEAGLVFEHRVRNLVQADWCAVN